MSFGVSFGNGKGIGVGEDIPSSGGGGSGGPSFIASLLDLLGLHHQVAGPGGAQEQSKAAEKPKSGSAGKPAKAPASDLESSSEAASPTEEPEPMGPQEAAGYVKFLNSFDSVLGTKRTNPGGIIPPLPPKQSWGLQTLDMGGGQF